MGQESKSMYGSVNFLGSVQETIARGEDSIMNNVPESSIIVSGSVTSRLHELCYDTQ